MKMRTLSLLGLALAVCLSSALVAQEDRGGRDRGRGGRGGLGFGGPGGGFSMGGALELMSLLRMEEVQKEVDMSADTYKTVQEAMPSMRDIFSADESERTAKLKEANEKAKELFDEVLSPEHQKRLMGLLVQQNGNRAATNELIAKEIGLDEAGIKKVQEAVAKANEASMAKMRENRPSREGGDGGFDPSRFQEMRENMRKDSDKAIAEALTADQLKALEALKGEKFTFPEGRFGPGGRPRGTRPGSDSSN